MQEKDTDRDYWFPAKKFGWGWGPPRRWEGWAVLGGHFVSLVLWSSVLTRGDHEVLFTIGVAVLTAILIAICYRKGEPPSWRWGGYR